MTLGTPTHAAHDQGVVDPGSPPVLTLTLRFDRGTILFDLHGYTADRAKATAGMHGQLEELGLAEVIYDPRVGRHRAPAHRYAEIIDKLHRGGITVLDQVARHGPLRLHFDAPPLRSYQQDALLAWELGSRRGVVVLPTGAGKTRLALAAIERAAAPSLILVPTRVLCEQWQATLQRAGCRRIGQLGDGRHDLAPLTISTFESALRHMDQIGGYFGTLVVDEVHHFGSGARIEALEMCAAQNRLGLTATLDDARGADDDTKRVLGPVLHRLGVMELTGTHLAPFDHTTVSVRLTAAERRVYDAHYSTFLTAHRGIRREFGFLPWADFVRHASASVPGRQALAGFHAARALVAGAQRKIEGVGDILERHCTQPVLIFCASNAAAYAVSRRYLIPAITADITRAERREILDNFRRGELRAIVSSRVLNEGVDIAEVAIGVIIGGVMGAREHVQRVGRLLRPQPDKRAHVYEFVVLDTFECNQAKQRRRGLVA